MKKEGSFCFLILFMVKNLYLLDFLQGVTQNSMSFILKDSEKLYNTVTP